jgi:hypothetical protein
VHGQRQASAALLPGKRPGTRCTRDWRLGACLDEYEKSGPHREIFHRNIHLFKYTAYMLTQFCIIELSASSLDVTATGRYTNLTGSLRHNTFRSTLLACTQALRYTQHTLPYHPHFPLHKKELLVSRMAATSTSCVRVLVHSPSRR